MRPVSFTPAARQDLRQIWSYSDQNWGRKQADGYVLQIDLACAGLASGKRLGRLLEGVFPKTWRFPVRSHVVFYAFSGETQIEVVRILHQRMDFLKHIPIGEFE